MQTTTSTPASFQIADKFFLDYIKTNQRILYLQHKFFLLKDNG